MLHEFLRSHRDAILARARATFSTRATVRAGDDAVDEGIPLFLDQLIAALRSASDEGPLPDAASRHGASLQREGFTIANVVQSYGGLCQAITELAVEAHVGIDVEGVPPPDVHWAGER